MFDNKLRKVIGDQQTADATRFRPNIGIDDVLVLLENLSYKSFEWHAACPNLVCQPRFRLSFSSYQTQLALRSIIRHGAHRREICTCENWKIERGRCRCCLIASPAHWNRGHLSRYFGICVTAGWRISVSHCAENQAVAPNAGVIFLKFFFETMKNVGKTAFVSACLLEDFGH